MKKNYSENKIKLILISGNGGNGIISFYRNKFITKGGPDGGNGGKGGNIFFTTDNNINSLNYLKNKKKIVAENGHNGGKNNRTGKKGKSIHIKIPINTKITILKKKKKIIYLKKNKKTILIVKGGKQGIGNNKFKSSTNRTPLKYTKGQKGKKIKIKIKQIYKYDIGIIGLPNSGKSSLFKKLTSNKTKIKNYLFTTLYPQIGILKNKNKNIKFSLVDTPALIKGSYKKKNGLGIKFLEYIINCKILLHIIEINTNINIIIKNIKIINNELNYYNKKIKNKKQWLIFNKYDLIKYKNIKKKIKKKLKYIKFNKKIFFISIKKNKGIKILKLKLYKYIIKN